MTLKHFVDEVAEELQNYLGDYNATWFQGYYYAKPLPAQSLETMVKEQLHAKE